MKKAILIFSALLLVVSGVAAVSAYEAHVVDVKAHVENALIVSDNIDYGIVFPQETLELEVYIGLSNSFMDEENTRVSDLDYALYWTPKAIYGGAIDPDGDGFFEPISPFIIPSFDAAESPLDGTVASGITCPSQKFYTLPVPTDYDLWAWGHLDAATDNHDIWHLKFYSPVFDLWSNNTTDPLGNWPHVLYLANLDYAIVSENFTASDGMLVIGDVPHADLGSNLKIQVYDYSYHATP